jgi:cytochrome c peroxidase
MRRCTAVNPGIRHAALSLAAALCLLFSPFARSLEPILPLPRSIEYDRPKAELGKQLFFDKQLSADGRIACASCHDPQHGGAEPWPTSIGVFDQRGRVNAPTVFNSYFNFRQFWNGRARDLQEQAAGPLHNPIEMAMTPEKVEGYLNDDRVYRERFKAVFGEGPIRFQQATEAIAEFEKALITPDSKLDRYLRGEAVLAPQEAAGYRLFKRLGCVTCHNGINIGGNSYQYLGAVIPVDIDAQGSDRYALTGDPFDKNRFKVPSLRNIALTAPYLHDGSGEDLEALVGMMAYHNLGFPLSKDETAKILVFLNTLTGRTPDILRP